MNFSRIKFLYLKELKEILRNWGLLILLIFFPLVVYPSTLVFLAEFGASQQEKLERQKSHIVIVGRNNAPELVGLLQDSSDLDIAFSDRTDPSTVAGKNKVIITIPKNIEGIARESNTASIQIYYDSTDDASRLAKGRVSEVLYDFKKELIYRRLESKSLNPEFVEPLALNFENTASRTKIAGQHLGEVLPLILISFIMLGTIQVAIDITAGEKERKTIQTLLLSPLSRLEILTSKLAIVLTTTLFATAVNFVSIGLTVYFVYKFTEKLQGITISFSSIFISLLLSIPLVVLISSLFLLVGFIAKNQLEANIYVLPILFIGLLPAALPSIPGIKYDFWMGLIPIANTALAVKSVFLGEHNMLNYITTFLSNSLYSVLVILFVSRIFQKEDIAFGGLSDLIFVKEDRTIPSTGEAILYFLGALSLYVFIGNDLQQRNLQWGLVASQVFLLLFPALYYLKKAGYRIKHVLRLRSPGIAPILMAPFIGWAALIISQFYETFQNSFLETPKEIEQFFIPLLTYHGVKEAIVVFLIIAVTPAIIEEIAFRGVILSGFQNSIKNRPLLCIIVGFLFALFHLNLYTLVPITFMGALLTYAVLRTGSLVTAMIIHFTINGTQIVLANLPIKDFALPDYSWIISLIVLVILLKYLPGARAEKEE